MSIHTGRCMCGAVRFSVTDRRSDFGACHCQMCRRWTGSAFLGLSVPLGSLTLEGQEHIRTIASSAWAERAWCDRCGTGLWYRLTADSPFAGAVELPIGLFDDLDGLEFRRELFFDHKPDCYSFAGERRQLTRKQVMRLFRVDLDR